MTWRITDADGKIVAETVTSLSCAPYTETPVEAELRIPSPLLWSTDEPNLYTLEAAVGRERTSVRFGVRSIAFDPDHGFLLNGKPLKLHGACVHQDFGGVGVALTDDLHEYKIRRLKEMGVNAYRCSHHAPAPALLDACDRLGVLVMDETRSFGTAPQAIRQLTDLIERDRNHPCVFIWSLGNEETAVQNEPRGHRLMEKMTRIVKQLDPTRPVTYGGNNGANFLGSNGAAEVRGINYLRNDKDPAWIEAYHAEHPEQPIIGTEESSYVMSRGGAVNDLGNGLLDASGNVTMPWGATPKGWVKFFEKRDHLAGSFMWTGFDYRGEPNPFYYTNVISSFGTIDLCGMEKPPFYYYRAWWTDEPVLKLAPHWNHKIGETVRVSVFTNCDEITLSLNGKKLESRRIERFDAPVFTVPFEAGILSVVGSRRGTILEDRLITSGKTARIECRSILSAKDDNGTMIYQLEAYDDRNIFCATATDELEITAENGQIVGVGNGDPSNWEAEQFPPEVQTRAIRSFRSDRGVYIVPEKAPNALPKRIDRLEIEEKRDGYEDDLRIVARYRTRSADIERVTFTAILCDVASFEYVEIERLGSPAEIYLNGEKLGETNGPDRQSCERNRPYRFYCRFAEGENELQMISDVGDLDLPAISGYVRVGKAIPRPSKIRLHYGKARVFVRSETPDRVKLRIDRTRS